MKKMHAPHLTEVQLTDAVLGARLAQCLKVTIPAAMAKTVETGRLAAFDLTWKPGMPDKPDIFWDSDVAKVLEAMAYSLTLQPDAELEKTYDEWVDKICCAQQPDGYLNTYFTVCEPEKRWTDLNTCHELYCAGHLMEAAVAGYELLGKRKFLDCMCRYADYIDSVFGLAAGKRRGWPGHEEIELALVKLYRATGVERYWKLAEYFLLDRGTEPNVFKTENPAIDQQHFQADIPLLEQRDAVGHAVRAMYLGAGIADVAALNGNQELFAVAERMFESVQSRRMYITGGVGSTFAGERFTKDYDLTNSSLMYAESCAAMGLMLFAVRMFQVTGEMRYLDTLERTLYNGALSGISLSGDKFFYTNYLEVDENTVSYNFGSPERQAWFWCSCCPTNYARILPQLGSFLYSIDEADNTIYLNIPAANTAQLRLNGKEISLKVESRYPAEGRILVTVETSGNFTLQCRIPGWCRSWRANVNGESVASTGFTRQWQSGDVVELELEMPPRRVWSNSKITGNAGRVALMRGPVVYALEEIDQSVPVRELVLRHDTELALAPAPQGIPGALPAITGEAWHESFDDNALYPECAPKRTPVNFVAIPYALWQNRGASNMAVWIRQE